MAGKGFIPVGLMTMHNKSSYMCRQHAGIEITLARSPIATGFCFGRAENLENYFFFTRMTSEEFDPNLYFKISALSAFG